MSDTDKTKPIWVLMRDGYHASRAVHFPHTPDHPCDLPDKPARGWARGQCYWAFEYRGVGLCGCSMCKADAFETPRRKKLRADAKRQIREQMSDG